MINTNLLIIFTCFLIICYLFIKHRHKYWDRRNIPYLKPKNLLLGHAVDLVFGRVSIVDYYLKIYEDLAPHKYGGIFDFLRPVLIVRDPELMKKILTKDFNYFVNRSEDFADENEPLSLNLPNLIDDQWKVLRAKLTTTFSATKIKIMFNLMNDCTEELIEVLDRAAEDGDYPEVKDIMSRFTTDVISSCIFGLKSDSLKNPDSIFRKMGKKVFRPSIRLYVVGLLGIFAPNVRKMLRLRIFGKDLEQFFKSIVLKNIRDREENNVHRNDFLDLLMALRNEPKNSQLAEEDKFELTDDLLVAQCFIFWGAGFETSSSVMTLVLYDLAKHKEIQERLFDEISSVLERHHKEMTYECLQEMTYLTQVVEETQRLRSIAPMLMRNCNHDYPLDEDFIIEKGTRVIMPTLGLQLDPQYFDNPHEYNPENFSKEAKAKRHHYAYLPFGEGPRMCIGMRFGLMQVKLGIATLIRNYEVSLSPKMNGPLKIDKRSIFIVAVEGGVWLNFKKRI